MNYSSKKRMLHRITMCVVMITMVSFFSCQKEISSENGNVIVTPPDLSTKIKSSVSGFVTDENDAAVSGAVVQFGASNTTTDKYGHFEMKNVQVVKTAAFVTVSKLGYFKGIKTYMATENKEAFFRIKLIPKTNVGNINATTGGNISLPNGSSIKLSANAVLNAATNATYSGTVKVAAYWINPESPDLNRIMPGDLRAIDKDGSLKLLKTFGMMAVELTGSGGELLQIAPGKTADITIPIPTSLSGDAPSSIPLWYFDENNGLWKEQGSAAKTGNKYTGSVSHFSFWNCDLPANYIQFDCTLKNSQGIPLQNMLVKISYLSNPVNAAFGYTDANGYVSGAIPANEQLLLEVIQYWACSSILYSQNLTTGSTNISLGTITVSSAGFCVVNGTLLDCNNAPVANGFLFHKIGSYIFGNAVFNGNINISIGLCTNNMTVDMAGEDFATMQGSGFSTYTLTTGVNTIGSIIACGNNIQEYFNYTINGTAHSFVYPADMINQNSYVFPPFDEITGYSFSSSSYGSLQYETQNIVAGSTQPFRDFRCTEITDSIAPIVSPSFVNITEYGNIGQYISGSFSGTLNGALPPYNVYTITCNFRVKRKY